MEVKGIVTIGLEHIHPHPDNPRKDLGDLTELAESIKKNGIMQNLTVIPKEGEPGEYITIIGHRRSAAAKLAGVTEAPCRVVEGMVVNAKCNPCKEPTKYVAGFFDGPRGRRGCLFDCKNEQCEIYQVKRFTESEAVKERIKIQNLNSQKGMQAGYIAALRKDAKITMMKMSQIAGCSPAEYSSYEHERKEFDPEIYRKCEKYLKKKEGGGRC